MQQLWQQLIEFLPEMSFTAVLDILFVAFLVYQFTLIVRGRRAERILIGIFVVAIVYGISILAGFDLLRTIIGNAVPYTAFALIVVFQSEIRRLLARIGKARMLSFGSRVGSSENVSEIVLALSVLSEQRVGALIVMERDIGLRTFIESGVQLDAYVSRDLILAIFQFGGALHDGAAIVQKDRIAAASCFLPLSMNPNVSRGLGTRHRAGIGVTEETDAMAIVVSEETGRISVCAHGEIDIDLTAKQVEERVLDHMAGRKSRTGSAVTQSLVLPRMERVEDAPKSKAEAS
jgi:diadenylate cyclase